MADPVTPVPVPPTPPQNFWQKNQVILTGIAMAIIVSLQQYLGQPTVNWAVIGFAALLAISSWAANNLRGKGVSVLGLIGVAGYAITSVAVNGTINLNQLILAFIVGLGALIAPPPKSASYETSPVIASAKAEAKSMDAAKKILSVLFIISISYSCNAQFFKPLPKPVQLSAGKFGLAKDSIQTGFRPVVGVTAILSNGATLGGGVGIGWQSNKWDVPSQTWVNQYSISGIAFLGSNGSSATISAGLVLGFLSFISLGPIYDFTNKKFGLATGVQLHFN